MIFFSAIFPFNIIDSVPPLTFNENYFLSTAHEKEALQVLYQLKETVDSQRDLVRAKDDELRTRTLEVDAVSPYFIPHQDSSFCC